jgi:hypothetical protein
MFEPSSHTAMPDTSPAGSSARMRVTGAMTTRLANLPSEVETKQQGAQHKERPHPQVLNVFKEGRFFAFQFVADELQHPEDLASNAITYTEIMYRVIVDFS